MSQLRSISNGSRPISSRANCPSTSAAPPRPPLPKPVTPLSVPISTVNPPGAPSMNSDRLALYSGYIDIGLATSTPVVDHDRGAGAYLDRGRLALVRTTRTLVIVSLLFSAWKPRVGNAGKAIRAVRQFRLVIRRISAPVRLFL